MLVTLFNDSVSNLTESFHRRFEQERVLERLKEIDRRANEEGLDRLDPDEDILIRIGMEVDDSGRVRKNSYGVFDLSWQAEEHPEWPEMIQREVEDLRDQIRRAHGQRLRYLIWAGMGGSAEDKAMYQAVGLLKKGIRCYILDSTDPVKLRAILEDLERHSRASLPEILRSTLVVGMAMGMTSYEPVVNLEHLTRLYDQYGIDSRPNFIYMTLPGSILDQFAQSRGFRRIELQPDGRNTTAGRHSGPLTRGSLYPLALAGQDLKSWIRGTFLGEDEVLQAWRLASFLHAHGIEGRDKVALLLPDALKGVSIWTKQDFEESLGKSEELGIKIIIGETPRLANYFAPKDPKQDRLFLAVVRRGLPDRVSTKVDLIRRTGYPVATLVIPRGAPLSRYMQFIHYVVFGLAYLREMNFVTQPNVELYKQIAAEIYQEAQQKGSIRETAEWQHMMETPYRATWGNITLYYHRCSLWQLAGEAREAPEIYAQILHALRREGKVEYGELTFFGDTRYSREGQALRRVLERSGEVLFRRRFRMPVDIYEGPAMNHSYHEMIIGHGRCFSTILTTEQQETIPEIDYRPDYHLAQFLATQLALERRSRPVVTLMLKDRSKDSLEQLEAFFRRAATCVKNWWL